MVNSFGFVRRAIVFCSIIDVNSIQTLRYFACSPFPIDWSLHGIYFIVKYIYPYYLLISIHSRYFYPAIIDMRFAYDISHSSLNLSAIIVLWGYAIDWLRYLPAFALRIAIDVLEIIGFWSCTHAFRGCRIVFGLYEDSNYWLNYTDALWYSL